MVGIRVRLTYPDSLVKEPIIAKMIKKFDVVPNIRTAQVVGDTGFVVLELDGLSSELDLAIAWFKELGIQVDVIGAEV